MIELEKIPLYNGIFYELSNQQWEYLPKNTGYRSVVYDRVFEYLIELNKKDDDWFVIPIMFIIGMNEFNRFRLYYQKREVQVMIEHFMSLGCRRRHDITNMVLKLMKSKIDLYNLNDIDIILEMIDMLNTGCDMEKILMMKMTY